MVKKYVLYVDMYEDDCEIDDLEMLSTSEILAIIECLAKELKLDYV